MIEGNRRGNKKEREGGVTTETDRVLERERRRARASMCQKELTDKGSGKDLVGPSVRKAKGTKDGRKAGKTEGS